MPALSSDILEQQFGPTKLEILKQDGNERIICTKAAESGDILELSRVVFRTEGPAAFPEVHGKVLGGVSMGTAFTEAGVPFRRDVRASQRSEPAVFTEQFGKTGAATVTDVSILVGPDSLPYADILEVYSPLVRPWELTNGSPSQETLARLRAFGDELADHGNDA